MPSQAICNRRFAHLHSTLQQQCMLGPRIPLGRRCRPLPLVSDTANTRVEAHGKAVPSSMSVHATGTVIMCDIGQALRHQQSHDCAATRRAPACLWSPRMFWDRAVEPRRGGEQTGVQPHLSGQDRAAASLREKPHREAGVEAVLVLYLGSDRGCNPVGSSAPSMSTFTLSNVGGTVGCNCDVPIWSPGSLWLTQCVS